MRFPVDITTQMSLLGGDIKARKRRGSLVRDSQPKGPLHVEREASLHGPSRARMALVGQELLPSGQAISADRVDGLIERVTYFNEDSGFCVLRVDASGHRDVVTVVGTLPSLRPGEWITAEGTWFRDKEDG